MTPLNAVQNLIAAVQWFKNEEGGHPDREVQAETDKAILLVEQMLDTALPPMSIARFRCYVDLTGNKKKGPLRSDFTISAPTIEGIVGGLIGLTNIQAEAHVTLWEQRPMGAEMVSGFQGTSKTKRYRSWIEEILKQFPTVEANQEEA